jgi:glutamate N-acetyltransferase/amino-acid N-acetyltransferase
VEESVELLAAELNIQPEEVLVSSTGVIGMFMNMETMKKGVKAIAPEVSEFGGAAASKAIMTTDTVPKEVSFTFEVAGKTATIGGMVKGSGMIHPNLGTMLGYITTDVAIGQTALHAMLLKAADATFNHATIDGDTSTNDSVFVAATGKLDNQLISSADDAGYAEVEAAVLSICSQLAQLLVKDGEGATKFVEVLVSGAKTMADAVSIGKSVATSSLVKTAMFGEDANWGRVITAAGYADTEYFDADVIDIAFSSKNGEIQLCEAGMGVVFDEELAKKILEADEINILIDLHLGTEAASTWTCDFSYDYVKINEDYRS